ncbi:MAG TPA: aldo/keto reductase, partial [Tepidisphaeraceae bacterium]|nr:aldo/keto reductase [Tepidisphaeraceae bacterium]
ETAAYAAALPDIYVIETSVNIVDQINIDKVLPVTIKHNVGVLAKRPIANAAWKQISQQADVFKGYIQPYSDRLAKMKLDPGELGFAGKPADVWPEIAIRFTLSVAGVSCAIIGTTNPENAKANLAAVDKGALGADVVEKIRERFSKMSVGENWPGLT